jgi:hypothetical protein
MKCTQIKNNFSDYLTGDIEKNSRAEIQKHVTQCDACRKELENLSAIWTKLGVLQEEQPSSELRSRFYETLEIYKHAQEQETGRNRLGNQMDSWFHRLIPQRPVFQFSFALLFLVVGLTAGLFIKGNWQRNAEIAQLRQEVSQIRQITAASLLGQESLREQLGETGQNFQVALPDRQALLDFLGQTDTNAVVDTRLLAFNILFPSSSENKQEYLESLSEQTYPLTEIAKALASNIGRF